MRHEERCGAARLRSCALARSASVNQEAKAAKWGSSSDHQRPNQSPTVLLVVWQTISRASSPLRSLSNAMNLEHQGHILRLNRASDRFGALLQALSPQKKKRKESVVLLMRNFIKLLVFLSLWKRLTVRALGRETRRRV